MEMRSLTSKVYNHDLDEVYSFYDVKKHMMTNEIVELAYGPKEIAFIINQKCLDLLLFSEDNIFSDMIKDFKAYDYNKNGIDGLIADLQKAKANKEMISIYLYDSDAQDKGSVLRGCRVMYIFHQLSEAVSKLDSTLLDYVDGLCIKFEVVGEEFCKDLTKYFTNLKKLIILSNCDIRNIKNIVGFTNLHTLNLVNKLDDKVIPYLKSIKNLKLLRYEQDTSAKDGVERKVFLTALNQLNNLKILELVIPDITDDETHQLELSLPNTIIITKPAIDITVNIIQWL